MSRADRRLLCVHRGGRGDASTDAILMLPPVAEEMNQVRSFHGRLARHLESNGLGALCFDVSCTGDSSGEFSDARWSEWQDDVCAAYDWLSERSSEVNVLAIGSAALHLTALLNGGRDLHRLCLVDPKTDGDSVLADLLRVKVARSMFEGRRETQASLREQFERGETVEIGGYEISAALFASIRDVRLEQEILAQVRGLRQIAVRAATDEESWLEGARRIELGLDWQWSVENPEPPPELLAAVSEALRT